MQKLIRTLGFAMLALSLASCRLVYVPDVQQGNLLDKKNVDQLKPGMTKRQVLVLLGSPSVSSPFDQDRWDYVSTQQHRGGAVKVRTLTLTFNNDALVRQEGDFFAQDNAQLLKDSKKFHTDYPVNETRGDKNTSGGGSSGGSSGSDSSGGNSGGGNSSGSSDAGSGKP